MTSPQTTASFNEPMKRPTVKMNAPNAPAMPNSYQGGGGDESNGATPSTQGETLKDSIKNKVQEHANLRPYPSGLKAPPSAKISAVVKQFPSNGEFIVEEYIPGKHYAIVVSGAIDDLSANIMTERNTLVFEKDMSPHLQATMNKVTERAKYIFSDLYQKNETLVTLIIYGVLLGFDATKDRSFIVHDIAHDATADGKIQLVSMAKRGSFAQFYRLRTPPMLASYRGEGLRDAFDDLMAKEPSTLHQWVEPHMTELDSQYGTTDIYNLKKHEGLVIRHISNSDKGSWTKPIIFMNTPLQEKRLDLKQKHYEETQQKQKNSQAQERISNDNWNNITSIAHKFYNSRRFNLIRKKYGPVTANNRKPYIARAHNIISADMMKYDLFTQCYSRLTPTQQDKFKIECVNLASQMVDAEIAR